MIGQKKKKNYQEGSAQKLREKKLLGGEFEIILTPQVCLSLPMEPRRGMGALRP